ncbi:MAG: MoaD/ThiS family protein [Parvularculaceae bacterium]
MVRVLFFGRLRESAGAGEKDLRLPDDVATPADLIAWLGAENAALGRALGDPSVKCVADLAIVSAQSSIRGVREIAFMPPVSGG